MRTAEGETMSRKSKVEELLRKNGNDAKLVIRDKLLVWTGGEWAIYALGMGGMGKDSRYFEKFEEALRVLSL